MTLHRGPRSTFLRTKNCLQSANTLWWNLLSFHVSVFFSVNNCIWLYSVFCFFFAFFALLTGVIGCESWKLVGRYVSLDCSLRPLLSWYLFYKAMRHQYTSERFNSNYNYDHGRTIWFKYSLSYGIAVLYITWQNKNMQRKNQLLLHLNRKSIVIAIGNSVESVC